MLSIVLVLGIHIIRKTRSSSIRFRGDLEKMINMEGKSNEERLYIGPTV